VKEKFKKNKTTLRVSLLSPGMQIYQTNSQQTAAQFKDSKYLL
jgi:hypothetical protein